MAWVISEGRQHGAAVTFSSRALKIGSPIKEVRFSMTLPPALADHVGMARNAITRADFISAPLMIRNMPAFMQNTRGMLNPTPEIDQAMAEVIRASSALGDTLRGSYAPARDRVEHDRAEALKAIDRLVAALAQATPNEIARGIGVDW